MSKKHYFVLSPSSSTERTVELKEKAKVYYGEKDYEDVIDDPNYMSSIKNAVPNPEIEFNVSMMLIGISVVAMSRCDSVYVAKGWDDDNYCKICHAIAFSHGVEIVYESV